MKGSTTERPIIEYYFSFVSLWSYVGSLIFQDIVKRRNAVVEFKPINLYAIFSAGGGKPVRERPLPRQGYRLIEMQRWRDQNKIPLVLWPKFYPADPSLGHRMLLVTLREGGDVNAFVHAGLRAVWADEKNVADPQTLVALANAAGLDGAKMLAQAGDPAIKARENELNEEAIGRHLFGAPFYFYRGEPFWGQDRLPQLEDAIVSGRAPVLWPKPDEL
jgi:2-hydroxychromene-2-carboxylate isomerase